MATEFELPSTEECETLRKMIIHSATHGADSTVGIKYVRVAPEECIAQIVCDERSQQPAGIVHGGIYAMLVEAAASAGATAWAASNLGLLRVVGVENTTHFLRSFSEGRLRARATPIKVGRSHQLWEVNINDDDGQLISTGTLRCFNLS